MLSEQRQWTQERRHDRLTLAWHGTPGNPLNLEHPVAQAPPKGIFMKLVFPQKKDDLS